MIRADHSQVMALFHRFKHSATPAGKKAIVAGVCLALEIHAQLEEEIFYPALRVAAGPLIEQLVPEHDEMRRLIGELRGMDPAAAGYDATFMTLMRAVIHHVADEETQLLPDAERVLGYRLTELGVDMTKRRLQLMAPRSTEVALTKARTLPKGGLALAAGAVLAGALVARTFRRH
ncbi:MAG: hemerythrin domain-containing protein [Betaproteobacteria bacterium]